MFQSKTLLLLSIVFLLFLSTATAQRITSNLGEGFTHVSVRGEKAVFYMLEDQRYAIVTDGIPMESLEYKVEKGILTIHLPKDNNKAKKSLVLLYPKGKQVPKVIYPLGNGLVRL
ncbi:MAG: hypothetical protein AAF039_18215 [Bacteroidota bacterium]